MDNARRRMYRRRRAAWGAVVLAVVVIPIVLVAAGGSSKVAPGSEATAADASHPATTTGPKLPPGRPLTIVWGGDTTLGSSYGDPGDGGRAEFANVLSTLRDADLTAVNLEGTLGTTGTSKCGSPPAANCFAFQGPPANAGSLRWAGVDIVNLANNHAWDFGATGMGQTVRALRAADVAYTGRPGEIKVLSLSGTKVAFLGFSAYKWTSPIRSLTQTRRLVREARALANVVVVFMHAGAEGADQTHVPVGTELAYGENRGDSRAFAQAAIDAGADLVVGSGPHVLRGMEVYKGRLIAYSLGNLAGWNNFATGGTLSVSALLRVKLAANGAFAGGQVVSLLLNKTDTASIDPTHAAVNLIRDVSRADFGAHAVHIGPSGTLHVSGR